MIEFHSVDELRGHLQAGKALDGIVIQSVDLSSVAKEIGSTSVTASVFLGCAFPDDLLCDVAKRGAYIFPTLPDLPFNPYAPTLYSADTLFAGFDADSPCSYCETPDAKIYKYWQSTGGASSSTIVGALARRLHDHAMTDALNDFLATFSPQRRIVAIMGGHGLERSLDTYLDVARISRELTRRGYLMVSGGGPGAMEATHVGAWFVDRPDSDLVAAVKELAKAPTYRDLNWLSAAFKVREKYPPGDDGKHASLGIPTWLYGHEPPTPFATHIAKYFANSVREEGLITIATSGLVFARGSAGTIQEAFQDATQNHYVTVGVASPMVFLDTDYWTNEKPIYPLLKQLAEGRSYHELIAIFDEPQAVVEFIDSNPPIQGDENGWSFCAAHCDDGIRST